MKRPASNLRRAFTIIEVIVVVVIIAIVAGATIPRLLAMSGRHVRGSAEAVGDMLSVAARREALTSQRVSVGYDDSMRQVTFLSLIAESGESGANTEWRPDRLVPPIVIGDDVMIQVVETDGAALDPRNWRIEFTPGVRRPGITIAITDSRGGDRWVVELPSTADHAMVSAGVGKGVLDNSVDLDAQGAGSAAW